MNEIKNWKLFHILWLFPFLMLITGASVRANKPFVKILSTTVICKEQGKYIGWPTITKTHKGDLVVVFSGDRELHIDPWGKTQMVRSSDEGKTWTKPVIINNTPLDDREAGVIETDKGTLLVSWVASISFAVPKRVSMIPEKIRNKWTRHIEKLGPETRRQWNGYWIRRSENDGKTWGIPIRSSVTAPHGPIQLSDKRLIYVGMKIQDGKRIIGVTESLDDGLTWNSISNVPIPSYDSAVNYMEPHVVEVGKGKLIAMFRYEKNYASQAYLRQSESNDGGKSWSIPHETPILGYPPHLIRLRNGWLLVSYGRRIPPFGERACISKDNGKTWDVENEIILSNSLSSDLGYPASVQLDDGSIFTVFYQRDEIGEKPSLMATHWQFSE